jgi:hypothetical protein
MADAGAARDGPMVAGRVARSAGRRRRTERRLRRILAVPPGAAGRHDGAAGQMDEADAARGQVAPAHQSVDGRDGAAERGHRLGLGHVLVGHRPPLPTPNPTAVLADVNAAGALCGARLAGRRSPRSVTALAAPVRG